MDEFEKRFKNRFSKIINRLFYWDFKSFKDPLERNEIYANRIVSYSSFLVVLIDIIFGSLYACNVFGSEYALRGHFLFLSAILIAIPAIVTIYKKGNGPWIKYMLLSALFSGLFLGFIIVGTSAILLLIAPLILSCRYYSGKFVLIFSLISMVVVFCAIPLSEIILYKMGSPEIDYKMTLGQLVSESIVYSAIPNLLFTFVIGVICTSSAMRGQTVAREEFATLQEHTIISGQLELAAQIQNGLVPNNFPPFPEHKEFDIFASMKAAKEVGGDFYDFFMIDDSNVVIVIGDVSGKGIPASLFMATVKTLIKDHANMGLQLGEVLTRVNKRICEANSFGYFITVWMARINLKTGLMAFVNAGHNPVLISNGKDNKFEYLKCRTGFVLGGLENYVYKQETLQLKPGSRLFLYTDGVTEATTKDEKLYGNDRLINYLNSNLKENNTKVINGLSDDISTFVGNAPQFDDITMLLFDLFNFRNVEEQTFDAVDSQLPNANKFVMGLLKANNAESKPMSQIEVALEELFVNVSHYAYKERKGLVSIEVEFYDNKVKILFKDSGIPFDPFSKADPDVTLSANERQIGGLGIYLVKKTMDSMEYEYKDNMNILTIIKTIKNTENSAS